MSPSGCARRRASLAAALGLVLLVTLASLPVISRLRVALAVRTVAVGRVPTAMGVDRGNRRAAGQ